MQDAYVVDQGVKGTMTQIGFEHPTSTVFTYAGNDATDFSATSTGLDKCSSQTWTVTTTITSKKASYSASDNCPQLTPNFKNIGSGS